MSNERPNDNCLLNMRCPNCGSLGPFWITVNASALMFDDGAEEYTEPEWDKDSYCYCPKCQGDTLQVRDFEIE